MPALYVMEMIADWMGAGKTYGSTLEEWLPNNLHKFRFGVSHKTVHDILNDMGVIVYSDLADDSKKRYPQDLILTTTMPVITELPQIW